MPEEKSPFGEDRSTIEELMQHPEDVHKLLIAKRKANAEAKSYREQIEIENERDSEIENLREKIGGFQKDRVANIFKIEALKIGIRPDRLEAAARIAEIPDDEDPMNAASKALEKLKDGFPELFKPKSPPPEVDNAGFSRARTDMFAIAKSSGDVMSMLKALRKR